MVLAFFELDYTEYKKFLYATVLEENVLIGSYLILNTFISSFDTRVNVLSRSRNLLRITFLGGLVY
jgi:hypothetical protein